MAFVYSIDRTNNHGFVGDFGTPHEAIIHAVMNHALTPGAKVYVGKDQRPPISNFVPSIIETMRDIAVEDFGDVAEKWPNPTHIQALKLQSDIEILVARWCEETDNTIHFYEVIDVVEFTVTNRHALEACETMFPVEEESDDTVVTDEARPQ